MRAATGPSSIRRDLDALRQHAVDDLCVDQIRAESTNAGAMRCAADDVDAERDRALLDPVTNRRSRMEEVVPGAGRLIEVRRDLVVFLVHRRAAGATSADDDGVDWREQMCEVRGK